LAGLTASGFASCTHQHTLRILSDPAKLTFPLSAPARRSCVSGAVLAGSKAVRVDAAPASPPPLWLYSVLWGAARGADAL